MRIITKETTFCQLSQQQKDAMAKGFHTHMGIQFDIQDLNVNDIYAMLIESDPKVIFHRKDGKDGFSLQLNRRKFMANFLSDRMITIKK